LDVARQLEAAGLWDGRPVLPAPGAQAQVAPPRGPGCLIVIHDAYDTHRKAPRAGTVQLTPVEKRVGAVDVHASIHDLIQGQDYEFAVRPA
jgi:hypothetical protein